MSDRLPFDPSRIRPHAGEPPGGTAATTLSVRQVNELVRGAINRHIPATIHVLGEVGDLSRPASGHLYFTLKDAASELRCVMWRSSAARLRFQLQGGLQVVATGGVEVYLPRGSYQLVVTRVEPRGVGALELAFRQLKEKLEREGLFDPARKKPIPRVPRRVAIVTSPSGAAIRDILQTLARRFPALDVFVYPVRVQGEGAADEVAAAVRILNEQAASLGGLDVLIVGRGGGSLEDLWTFNEEVVARAIAASDVPVVSAVGHEVDFSISDFVADLRGPTPTAAAELITPLRSELIEQLLRGVTRASRGVRLLCDAARRDLDASLSHPELSRPLARVNERRQRIDETGHRLRHALVARVREQRARLVRAEMVALRFGAGAAFARLRQRLIETTLRLSHAAARSTQQRERRLAAALERLRRAAPPQRIARLDEHVRHARLRVFAALRRGVSHARQRLVLRWDAIAACDPKRVLQRGYSLTRDARTRKVVRSIREIHEGARILTQLVDGEFKSSAEDPRQARLFE
ncbi:MAG: exodeoxyribonuclease VII large subunit [Phycisphaerae bacterium]